MGSFSQTCCISGLPISAGDDIRYILLTENPYEESLICSMHDMWFPRTYPLRAKYNDYGSIEDYDPECPGIYAIIEGLKEDMIEIGTGNNSAHDVPTKKGMNFKETLNAIWEGRILVQREVDTFKKPDRLAQKNNELVQSLLEALKKSGHDTSELEGKLEGLSRKKETQEEQINKSRPWAPTLQRVSKIITDAGYQIANTDLGYLVDEKGRGWVRVRSGGYGDRASLDPIKTLLSDHYAVMTTAGTGSYAHRKELQVMPLPTPEGEQQRSFLDEYPDKPLRVYQGMILEEVWQGIINFGKFKKYRADLQKEWDEAEKELERSGSFGYVNSPIRSVIPFTMGFEQHFKLVVEKHQENPFSSKQIATFLDNVAGTLCIYEVLSPLCYWWRPSFPVGPQCGEFVQHEQWSQQPPLKSGGL